MTVYFCLQSFHMLPETLHICWNAQYIPAFTDALLMNFLNYSCVYDKVQFIVLLSYHVVFLVPFLKMKQGWFNALMKLLLLFFV